MSILYKQTISDLYGRGYNFSALGIEVEMEPKNKDKGIVVDDDPEFWKFRGDGSLRQGGVEAVSEPTRYADVDKVLDDLDTSIDFKNVADDSPRTSVHVHDNVGHFTLAQVVNLYALYLLVEDLLITLSGKSRRGNNFALSSQSAGGLTEYLRQCIKDNEKPHLNEQDRYASFNIVPLRTFGTVEYRSMRGLNNIDDIRDWVNIIIDMNSIAIRFESPKHMLMERMENLIPNSILKYFNKDKALEVMNSNYSDALSLVYAHPTQWDFTDPDCDIREKQEFVDWLKAQKKWDDRRILQMTTADLNSYMKRFIKGDNLNDPDALTAYKWIVEDLNLNRPNLLREAAIRQMPVVDNNLVWVNFAEDEDIEVI